MADENNTTVIVPTVDLSIAEAWPVAETFDPVIKTTKRTKADFDKMRHTVYQARLGRYTDRITRRVTDNNIRLSSHPTDMIRLKVERDPRSRDLESRQIISWEVLPIILPVMKDVPLRHLIREGADIQIPSLYTIDQQTYFEIYAPVEVKLEPEDLLFRIIYDPNTQEPYVMALQVKEQLATVGYSSINMLKFWVTFYDEKLPAQVVKILKDANERRETLGW